MAERSRLSQVRHELEAALEAIIQDLGAPPGTPVVLSEPTEAGRADLATSVAFGLARTLRKSPRDIAAEMSARFSGHPAVRALQADGPGYVNVWLRVEFLAGILDDVLENPRSFGRSDEGQGARVLLEFVSANPTGPLNVVSGRAAALGDSLARLLNFTGWRADKEFYLNNAGVQILKLGQAVDLRIRELFGEEVESTWPEGVYPGAYVRDVARAYLDQRGADAPRSHEVLGAFAADFFTDRQREVLERFRVHYDSWAEERRFRESGAAEGVIAALRESGHLYDQDGAVWFRSTAFGDDKDRVVVKSDGSLTYIVPDAAYHWDKVNRGYERLIDLLGPDHHGYVSRITAILEALSGQGSRLLVLIVQLVRLMRGQEAVRMSKRGGEFVELTELLDEAGVDAARFFFIERASETPLDFDLGLALLNTQANPVFYVQYAGARIRSILRQAAHETVGDGPAAPMTSDEERALLWDLASFPDVVDRAARELSPHFLTRYLVEFAGHFHGFYRQHRVLGGEADTVRARLRLVRAVLAVLETATGLIGVEIPENM
jgi:arginyl-tRNA synthetase